MLGFLLFWAATEGRTQPPGGKDGKGKDGKGDFGFGQPGGKGFGGFGPPGGQERKVVKDFDKNGDGWLNKDERAAARESLKKGGGGFGPGFGGPKGFGPGGGIATGPGPKVSPADVQNYPKAKLYDPTVLRTAFLEFENADWEAELQDFHGTDVDVPATLTVDGKKYPNVGVHFRGMSSYGGVPMGAKRSLNLSIDMADPKQRVHGYKTLNLLNAHEDPSFLCTALYSHVARQYIPAPKANVMKVVVNGESWGIYSNVQQFDKVFLEENFKTSKGTRWKVSGSPGGGGGLDYIGDDIANYKRRYEIKSGDDEKAWKALILLCKTLSETPPDKLEAALAPMIDLDGLLWFLALDIALINCDGYWIRASDFSIYLDEKNKFHIIPHDMNEAFRPAGGPGFGGGPGGGFAMRMPTPGEVLPPPFPDILRLTDDQKKKLAELQKETDAKLDKLLTGEQRAMVKQMKDRGPTGPGGFGPPGGPPPGGPGFGPPPGGPGGGPGMGARGNPMELDPLIGLDDARKPLRSKVLAVPSLRAKYIANVKTIADKSLDWKTLGPVVARYRTLIEKEVEIDTRKLDSFEAFKRATADEPPSGPMAGGPGGPGRGPGISLRAFADQRRKYLMDYAEKK